MATQDTTVPGSGSGNPYIDALLWGCKWADGPVRYWFGAGLVTDSLLPSFTSPAWSDGAKAAFVHALAQVSAVCELEFAPASGAGTADVIWWQAPVSALGTNVLGMHEVPDGSASPLYGYFGYQYSSWSDLTLGSYGYVTVIHELGHGLGLAHPHDGGGEHDATAFPGVSGYASTGNNGLNQGIWTTMSYNGGWAAAPSSTLAYGWQMTPMAFDVAALQQLYGANMAFATGDDSYQLPTANQSGTGWACIWDAGGSDTITNSGSALACTIDLNAAPLTGPNAAGTVSVATGILGGYTIAHDAWIENATGGAGADLLIGNALANVLDGGAGNDTLRGGAGDDIYLVDAKRDAVTEAHGAGDDTVHAMVTFTLPANVEHLVLAGSSAINGTGNALANALTGNAARNQLSGGDGSDTLEGAAGGDQLSGGRGADLFILHAGDAGLGTAQRDVVKDFKAAEGDRLLLAMDADTVLDGTQAFSFVGARFSGAAGQLRFSGKLLAGDTDGDGVADFEIELAGVRVFDPAAMLA